MSSAPRPQTSPPRTSPPKGSAAHSGGSASTTSVCESRSSVGPSPRPGMRATRLARSGILAWSSQATPFSSRYARKSSAAPVSFPGGLVVSTRMSSCNSSVTSSRSEMGVMLETMPWNLRLFAFFFLGPRGQLVARTPQRREEVVVDHLPEHFHRCALRAHDLVADDARDDFVVTNAPHRDALIPLDQRLGKLVELLVLPRPYVELDEIEAGLRDGGVERFAERRRDAPDFAEPRRIEAAPVTEDAPDRLVLPRRH